MTLNTPVEVFYLEDSPLKDNLRRTLRPIRLGYRVKDGLLTISSLDEIRDLEIRDMKEEIKRLTERLEVAEGRQGKPVESAPKSTTPR